MVDKNLETLKEEYGFYKNYPKETPKNLDYPEITLGQLLEQAAQKYPNSDA